VRVDGPEGGCDGGETGRGWVSGGGLVILRGPALTHVSPLHGTEGARAGGREGGRGGGWWRLSVHGAPVLISLVHPLPQESPLDHGKRRVDKVGKMSACVHTK